MKGMTTAATPGAPRPWGAARAILAGTLTVGALDGIYAIVYFGSKGASPTRIFQSVAVAVLGKEAAFGGGTSAALLGVALHFCVACAIVSTFYLIAGRIPALARRPIVWGLLYGIAAYLGMNLVVLPIFGIHPAFVPATFLNGMVAHAFLVGLPAALFARRGRHGSFLPG
jgi:hypothetical protein